jgi:drug/metabolite transporter (DMT)-like permease
MTPAAWVALAITIVGAFAYAAASILQAVGARRSTTTVRTMGHPLYLIGTGCDVLAWVGSMIALRELAVYLVESILAGSLAITVVFARLFLKSRLRRRDMAAVVVSVAALTVLAMSAGPQESVTASTGLRVWFCAAALAAAVIGWVTARKGSAGAAAGLAGLSLGGAALVGRALSFPPHAMDSVPAAALAIVTEPLVAALVTLAGTGMLLYANALQKGQVGPVTAVLWIAEVVAPSTVALAFLGDSVRPGWELAAAVSGLVTVGAAVLLATAPANADTAAAAEAPPALPVPTAQPALPVPARPAAARNAERIIWWGPPPIWIPPDRTAPALASQAEPITQG